MSFNRECKKQLCWRVRYKKTISDWFILSLNSIILTKQNQSSVMDNLQQAALSRNLASKDPAANQMTGLMAMLAKATSMQNQRQRPPPSERDSRSGMSHGRFEPSESSNVQSDRTTTGANPASAATASSTEDVLAKLMSALSTSSSGGSSDSAAAGGASAVVNSPDFYSAMQGMCSDLNAIKEQEKETSSM